MLKAALVSLFIVTLIVSDLEISGATTYFFATLIIWITTTIATIAGGRQIRDNR